MVDYSYKKGDVRYYSETGTMTSVAGTGTASIDPSGAIYHSMQIESSAQLTTTAQAVIKLQGSLDDTNWFDMNELTITGNEVGLISVQEATRNIRGLIGSVNTVSAFQIGFKNFGMAAGGGT